MPADFAAELRAAMEVEGFNSLAEFTHAALREKLERSARRGLEVALLDGLRSADSVAATEDFVEELRASVRRLGCDNTRS